MFNSRSNRVSKSCTLFRTRHSRQSGSFIFILPMFHLCNMQLSDFISPFQFYSTKTIGFHRQLRFPPSLCCNTWPIRNYYTSWGNSLNLNPRSTILCAHDAVSEYNEHVLLEEFYLLVYLIKLVKGKLSRKRLPVK